MPYDNLKRSATQEKPRGHSTTGKRDTPDRLETVIGKMQPIICVNLGKQMSVKNKIQLGSLFLGPFFYTYRKYGGLF